MTRFAELYARWLADYYLLATILLALALVGIALLKQPAQRLAIAKSTLVSLVLLAVLSAVPGWSIVHLLTDVAPLPESHNELSAKRVGDSEPERPTVFDVPAVAHDDRVVPRTNKPSTDIHLSWPALLATTHLAGAACIMLWLTLGWFASARLRRTARPAPPEVVDILNQVFEQMHGSLQRPRLLTHDRIEVAVALGAWQPTILLPGRWTRHESQDQLQTVLAHESTHILNHDLRWVALTRILFIALWANPLFWITRRLLRRDQEALADAAAAELTSRQRYAEQLVAWARDVHSRPALHLSSAVGLWEGPSQLRQRIAILLNERFIVLRNCSRRWRMVTAVASIATAAALSMLTLQPTTRANEKTPPSEQSPVIPSTVTIKAEPHKLSARPQPNTITGRVVDENDQPIAGAEAFLFRINRIDNSRKLVAKQSTDAEGKYRFENVIDIPKEFPDKKFLPLNPLEEEFIQVFVRAPARVAGMGMDLRQRIASTGEVFDMTLSPAATLSGRITGPDGKPVAGALVSVGGSGFATWEGVESSRTKADGTYVINDVPPNSMDEYRKKEAEQRRSEEAFRSNKDHYSVYVAPPVVTVEHPDFAIKRALYEKSPGTQDVKLDAAAVVEGRVVFGDSRKPATGAIVHLATSRSNNTLPTAEQSMSLHYVDFRADAEGKYRFAMLPAGNYDLSAEMPDWVNVGIDAFAAPSGKTSTPPNLILTKGGIISIRLINDKTGKPIALTPDTRADISVHQYPFPKGINRPSWTPNAAANSVGRFELHTLPDKRAIMVTIVYVGEKPVWQGKTSPGELKLPTVDVVEGKTVEVDIPVVNNEMKATGWYESLQTAPAEQPKPSPKTKSSSDRAAKPAAADSDDKHGSQMLRDIRAAAAPLLAKMAKEHGYGLKPGQDLVRVAPPFAPIRMEYYRIGHPTQSEAIRRGPSAMLFHWTNGHLENRGMTFGQATDSGYDLLDLANVILGVKSQSIELEPDLPKTNTPGDWVVRTGAEKAALAKQLEKILQDELSLPVRLEFREVNRPVYVARGNYRITPLAGHKANEKLILTDETLTTDKIEIFGKELVPNSGAGGGTDHFDVFLDWLGRWIGTPIVSEVTKPPSNQLSWHLHERSPSTDQTRREDHDPKLVLANITAQTGLMFAQENRPVKILFVERSQP